MLLLVGVASTRRAAGVHARRRAAAGAVVSLRPGGRAPARSRSRSPTATSDFDRVAFTLGTATAAPGPGGHRTSGRSTAATFARGASPAGTRDTRRRRRVAVGHVDDARDRCASACATRADPVAVYGNGDLASRTSSTVLDGKPLGVDISLAFERAEPRSALSMLRRPFSRARPYGAPAGSARGPTGCSPRSSCSRCPALLGGRAALAPSTSVVHLGLDLLFLVPGRDGRPGDVLARAAQRRCATLSRRLRVTTFLNADDGGRAGAAGGPSVPTGRCVLPRVVGAPARRVGARRGGRRSAARRGAAGVDVLHSPGQPRQRRGGRSRACSRCTT